MFAQLRTWFIEKLGGYSTIDQAIDAIREINYQEKNRILTLAVKKLFNTIGPDDILHVHEETQQWMFRGRTLQKEQKSLLIAEATQFLNMSIWEVLQDDIKYQSTRKMFILGKSDTDLVAGKLWLYTLDAIKTRLESMRDGSGAFNKGQ